MMVWLYCDVVAVFVMGMAVFMMEVAVFVMEWLYL